MVLLDDLMQALTTKGYYSHSIPEESLSTTCQAAGESIKLFYEGPIELKLRGVSKDRARRGFSPSSSENFASLVGELKSNDNVEKFRVGPEVSLEDRGQHSMYYGSKAGKVHFFPNDWSNVSPTFQQHALQLYDEAESLMHQVLDALSEAAAIQPLAPVFNRHTSILSINHYPHNHTAALSSPSSSQAEHAVRIAEHTDVSFFTIVASIVDRDSSASTVLQVYDRVSNTWETLSLHQPGTFAVLAGEYLEYVSNGRFPAALHRVIDLRGPVEPELFLPRISFAFFVAPNYDCFLNLYREHEDEQPDNPADGRDPLVSYDEWRKRKIAQVMKVVQKQK